MLLFSRPAALAQQSLKSEVTFRHRYPVQTSGFASRKRKSEVRSDDLCIGTQRSATPASDFEALHRLRMGLGNFSHRGTGRIVFESDFVRSDLARGHQRTPLLVTTKPQLAGSQKSEVGSQKSAHETVGRAPRQRDFAASCCRVRQSATVPHALCVQHRRTSRSECWLWS